MYHLDYIDATYMYVHMYTYTQRKQKITCMYTCEIINTACFMYVYMYLY